MSWRFVEFTVSQNQVFTNAFAILNACLYTYAYARTACHLVLTFHEVAINAHEQFPMKYLWFSKIWRRCCETPFDSFECQDNLCEAISKRFKNIPHNFGLTRMLLQNNWWWFEISKKLLGNNLHNCQFVYSWCLNFQKTKWCDENMQERCCEAIYKSFQWNINFVLKCERDLKARYPVKFASLRQTAAAYAALV